MAIKILDSYLASQIAAGEVVERPASVLKELLENSLDAKATNLEIDVLQGGTDLIRVRDNGLGITKEDLPLALHRHATSKITNLEDLERILTLGFRGEALASIGSVARLAISSRASDQNTAWQIIAGNFNEEQKIIPAAHPPGTTVEIRDLFFNTPARRKFLRSTQTEFRQLEEVVNRLALSRFDVDFVLKHNERLILKFISAQTVAEKVERICAILGKDFTEQMLSVENSNNQNDIKLTGWISQPTFSRNQADLQYTYLNGRIIRDKTINHAIRSAYQDVLASGRQPAFVLYIELNPETVDVNVHPTKSEVRFRDSRLIHNFITHSIRQVLSRTTPTYTEQQISFAPKQTTTVEIENELPQTKPFSIDQFKKRQIPLTVDEKSIIIHPQMENKTIQPTMEYPLGQALAELHGIYILAQNTQGLVLVDAHAAHERITYEKLKTAYQNNSLKSQPLLIPLTLTATHKEIACAEEYQPKLAELGLELECVGTATLAIRKIPALLDCADAENLVHDILSDLAEYEASNSIERCIDQILTTYACHHSIRANRKMNIWEMNELLRSLESTERGNQCGHGRPTWRQITIEEIAKMFGR